MAMPEILVQEWECLNTENQQQARNFIHLLLTKQSQTEPRKHPERKLGILAHRFHSIADDFNDPLIEFEEYLG